MRILASPMLKAVVISLFVTGCRGGASTPASPLGNVGTPPLEKPDNSKLIGEVFTALAKTFTYIRKRVQESYPPNSPRAGTRRGHIRGRLRLADSGAKAPIAAPLVRLQ